MVVWVYGQGGSTPIPTNNNIYYTFISLISKLKWQTFLQRWDRSGLVIEPLTTKYILYKCFFNSFTLTDRHISRGGMGGGTSPHQPSEKEFLLLFSFLPTLPPDQQPSNFFTFLFLRLVWMFSGWLLYTSPTTLILVIWCVFKVFFSTVINQIFFTTIPILFILKKKPSCVPLRRLLLYNIYGDLYWVGQSSTNFIASLLK